MAAVHWMERNQPQQVAPNAASHAACKTIVSMSRKGRRGSMRLKTRLRPRPERTTQANAATGSSQRSTAVMWGR